MGVAGMAREQCGGGSGSGVGAVRRGQNSKQPESPQQLVSVIKSLLLLGQGTVRDQEATVRVVEGWCAECLEADAWVGYRLARWALVHS